MNQKPNFLTVVIMLLLFFSFLGALAAMAVWRYRAVTIAEDYTKLSKEFLGCSDKLIDLQSGMTVLVDAQPQGEKTGLLLLDGWVELRPGQRFRETQGATGGAVPRWFIPYKVEPVLYGNPDEAAGARYYYIDTLSEKITGPYKPQVR